jgi:hypothetical protein
MQSLDDRRIPAGSAVSGPEKARSGVGLDIDNFSTTFQDLAL